MGRFLLVFRLATRNLRRRPAEAALLLLAITAATTVLSLGLLLHGVTDNPYQRTREATDGADVVASVGPLTIAPGRAVPVDPVDLARLEALTEVAGVVDHSGPYPATTAELEADGVRAEVWAVGRDSAEVSVDQPALTQGSWVEDGGVVVEAAFADLLDVDAGDQITLNGRSFQVVGVAVTAAASYTDVCFGHPACSFFIGSQPDQARQRPPSAPPDGQTATVDVDPPPDDAGLVWLTQTDARGLAPADGALSYVINLKLADPADAPAFVDAHSPTSWDTLFLASWQDIRDTYGEFVRGAQEALVTFSSLLTLLAVASVAVLVGGRMADQTRRVGLLKAVGGTPGLVAVVLLAEYVVMALLAAAAGLAVGWLAAPLLGDPGAGLLGSAGAPSLTVSTVGVVTAVAVGVAVLASLGFRGPRRPHEHRPRPGRLGPPTPTYALADRVLDAAADPPAPRLAGDRPAAAPRPSGRCQHRRHGQRDRRRHGGPRRDGRRLGRALQSGPTGRPGEPGAAGDRGHAGRSGRGQRDRHHVGGRATDARHASALARALGATPGEVSAGLSAAQVLPAFAGAVLGVAGGLALWAAIGDEHDPTYWQLPVVVAGTVLVVAALTTIPARIGARRPTAEILQAELA